MARRALGRSVWVSQVEQSAERTKGAAMVVLLSLDRNRAAVRIPSDCRPGLSDTFLSFISPSQGKCAELRRF
jgi:hypothetical protein